MTTSTEMTLYGEYQDTIRRGRAPPRVSGWRPNRIVSSAWPLVAALLRGEPPMRGIAFCAVGAGHAKWDDAMPATEPDTPHLARELLRVPIAASGIAFIDATGAATPTPTHRIEITVRLAATDQAIQIREFALFGGEATAEPGSGRMINHVIHSRIDLAPRATLTRTIRLSFRPEGGRARADDLLHLPTHWLADERADRVDGVGAKVRDALEALGVTTIGALARLDRRASSPSIAAAKAIELRGKARLVLRTATDLASVRALAGLPVRDILAGDAHSLPGALDAATVQRLHEQLSLLQIGLDARFLARTTLGALTRAR